MASEETDAVEKPTRRAAAKKASRLAAAQLESSDDESATPSFGEPSKRKAQVKVKYGKRKATKTDFAQSPTPPPSQRHAASSSRSQTVSSGLKHSHEPKHSTQAQPSKLSEAQYIYSSDDDIEILDGPPLPLQKQAPRRKRSSLGQGENHGRSGPKKRKYSSSKPGSSSEYHAGSRLTPLTSRPPEASPAKADGSRAASRDRSRHATDTRASPSRERSPMSFSSRYKRTPVPTPTRPFDIKYDALDLDEDVVLVFVRLDHSGALSESREAMWWPAQVCDAFSLFW